MSEAEKEAVAITTEEKLVKETTVPKGGAENREGDTRGSKRSAPDSTDDIQVSSANDWEHADLGDHGRKNKFLRLMGASKKDHHGTFVIGDKERAADRTAENTSYLSENLEHQYEQSMAHKLQGGPQGHIGFGFEEEAEPPVDNDKTVSSSENDAAENNPQTTENNDKDKEVKDKQSTPDSSTQSPKSGDNYGFVKSP